MKALTYLHQQYLTHSFDPALEGLMAPFFELTHDSEYQSEWMKVARQNYLYLKEARAIEEALCEAGFRFTWLKGMYLLGTVYSRQFARPMSDLDIFLEDGDISHWEGVLQNLGFKRERARSKLSLNKYEFIKVIEGQEVCLEVHTSLYFDCHKEAQAQSDFPQSFEEHFVYLLYHYLRQHSGGRLIWLLDILTMAKEVPLDWKRVRELLIERDLVRAYQTLIAGLSGFEELPILFKKRIWGVNLFKVGLRSWRYYLIKHQVRGLKASLRYNSLWVKEKLISRS